MALAFVSTKTHKVPDHPCQLECTDALDIISDFVDSGYFVHFRRKFRKMCLVSETNPVSKMFFKSSSEIHEEQLRHLRHAYYMIHPFSELRTYWENLMIIVLFNLLGVLIPMHLGYIGRPPLLVILPKFMLDIVCYVDVGVNFYTGYVVKETRKVELRPKVVRNHYLYGNHYVDGLFLVDVLSSLPTTLLLRIAGSKTANFSEFVFFLKLFRFPTMYHYIRSYFLRRKFWSANVRSFLLFVWFFIVIFWLCESGIFLSHLSTSGRADFVVDDVLNTTLFVLDKFVFLIECLTLVGPDPLGEDVQVDYKIMTIFYVLLGSFLNMVIMSQIVTIYTSRNAARNKHQELLLEIEQFSRYKAISPDLRDKIMAHVEFKYHRKILREAEIMNTLSDMLREEILLYKSQNLVEKVDFFKDLPPLLRTSIVRKLRMEVFLKNEVIFPIGSIGTCMFFIAVGSVAIYSEVGREVLRFGEGKHFGEITVISNAPRMYTAVARTNCELLMLRRSDILDVLKPYPEFLAQMKDLAAEKQTRMTALLQRISAGERVSLVP